MNLAFRYHSMYPSHLVLVSAEDPVAARVVERWGTPEATGLFVDGAPIRQLNSNTFILRRPGIHIHDEHVDLRLPPEIRDHRTTLIFPSIHRSEQNVECLTVHPVGNPGPSADVGGRARTLAPADARAMGAALRRLAERGAEAGLSATYEATHHGPEVDLPAFFVEIGYGTAAFPSDSAVQVLADVIPEITPETSDHVALGIGGGHYAPHFTDLTLRRRWAFGHILSRHALESIEKATAQAALKQTLGAEGVLFARAEDTKVPAFEGIGQRLRESGAPRRDSAPAPTDASRPASGT
jgi:D-aminoacyl-tRNA deacylase